MAWEKPKTIKLYLHPPEARKFITIWPDFKLVCAEVDPIEGTHNFNAYGIRVLFGENSIAPDWTKSQFIVRSDGIPVHFLKTNFEEFEYLVEAFCSWEEKPKTFVRLTITNNSGTKRTLKTGIMPRAGIDGLLYGITKDFYASYKPLLEHWDMVSNDFNLKDNCLTNGRVSILFNTGNSELKWVSQNPKNIFAKNYLEISQEIRPLETVSYYFVMHETKEKIQVSSQNHGFEKKQVVSNWEKELNKIKFVPDVKSDDVFRPIIFSLVCQCLQMFVKDDGISARPRQGGRWAGVWPVEAMEFLIALDMMGLYDWSEKGYRFFLKHQSKEGENKGRFNSYLAAQWENITGGVLFGLSKHILATGDEKCFRFWRQSMLDGYEWIRQKRRKSSNGLFPPGRPHDWDYDVQSWCFTDSLNFMGIREMAHVFSHFNDEKAQEIKKEAQDYKDCLVRVLNEIVEKQKDRQEVFIPNYLGIPESYPPKGPYFGDGPSMLIRAGIIESESEVFEKVEKYFRNRGWMKNGLTGLMTDCLMPSYASDPWAGHTWYVSFSDLCWFFAWMKRGEREKAFETLWAQVRYGMSEEYYMLERFADNDPSFCPWQPNASANGRLLQMLFEFYGAKKIYREEI
ncbi:MAG: hypothetical protein NC913_03970 [Candidatus Omnitrophica bacterium]|nr:hypothetical protein [Candidatus Omnitrophota bacterium]